MTRLTCPRPTVLLVGSTDVDARVAMMQELKPYYDIAALGVSDLPRRAIEDAGFNYYAYPLPRGLHALSDVKAYRHLVHLFRGLRPDIVHTFDTKPNVWARLAAKRAGTPAVVGTMTGLGMMYAGNINALHLVRFVYELLQRRACRASDLTIFQNSDDREYFIQRKIVARNRCCVLGGSGVATSEYLASRISEESKASALSAGQIAPTDLVIVMVSRLRRSKGVLEYARSARMLRIKYSRTKWLLVGENDLDAPDRLSEQELAEVNESVTWLGRREDIPAILCVSHMAVLPSYREGTPRFLLEASATGLPMVTTDVPGCREVVRHEDNGLLVPPRDTVALAEAIEVLLRDPERRAMFGRRARERALAEFDIKTVAQRTRVLYDQLLSRGSGTEVPSAELIHESVR